MTQPPANIAYLEDWITHRNLQKWFDTQTIEVHQTPTGWHLYQHCRNYHPQTTTPTHRTLLSMPKSRTPPPTPATKTKMTWAQYRQGPKCEACGTPGHIRTSRNLNKGPHTTTINLLKALHSLETRICETKQTKTTHAPRTIADKLKKLESALTTAQEYKEQTRDETLEEIYNQLEQHAHQQQQRLTNTATTDRARHTIEKTARRAILGLETLAPLDETPTLLAYTPKNGHGTQFEAISQAYHIHETTNSKIVLVPNFLAQWMLQTKLAGKKTKTTLHTIHTQNEHTPTLIEITAQLWDPTSNGPLASMTGAWQTACTLENPDTPHNENQP